MLHYSVRSIRGGFQVRQSERSALVRNPGPIPSAPVENLRNRCCAVPRLAAVARNQKLQFPGFSVSIPLCHICCVQSTEINRQAAKCIPARIAALYCQLANFPETRFWLSVSDTVVVSSGTVGVVRDRLAGANRQAFAAACKLVDRRGLCCFFAGFRKLDCPSRHGRNTRPCP